MDENFGDGGTKAAMAVPRSITASSSHGYDPIWNDTADNDSSSDTKPIIPDEPRQRSKNADAKRKHVQWILSILLTLAPAILLAAFTPQLSSQIGRSGCSPSGDFVVPYTTNIWERSLFFIPSLGFSVGSGASHSGLTIVRIIDIAWDLAAARGGQALLAWVAYRVFRRALQAQMQAGEVGYDVFGEVALHTGQVRTLPPLWRRTFGKVPLPRTSGARRTYIGMGFVTLYLLAMPTLFSAMAGYASVGWPSIQIEGPPKFSLNHTENISTMRSGTFQDCEGPLLPAFGTLQHSCFEGAFPISRASDLCDDDFDYLTHAPLSGLPDFSPMPFPWHPYTCGAYDWWDYYERYRRYFDECPKVGNDIDGFSPAPNCSVLDRESYVKVQCRGYTAQLHAPLLNLTIYPPPETKEQREQSHGHLYFSCAGRLVRRSWLKLHRKEHRCQASTDYAWGFSFHLLVITSLLSGAVVGALYDLWAQARRLCPMRSDTNGFLDAALMVSRAQQQFGANVHEWTTKKVEQVILKGDRGMGDPPAYVRLRNLR